MGGVPFEFHAFKIRLPFTVHLFVDFSKFPLLFLMIIMYWLRPLATSSTGPIIRWR